MLPFSPVPPVQANLWPSSPQVKCLGSSCYRSITSEVEIRWGREPWSFPFKFMCRKKHECILSHPRVPSMSEAGGWKWLSDSAGDLQAWGVCMKGSSKSQSSALIFIVRGRKERRERHEMLLESLGTRKPYEYNSHLTTCNSVCLNVWCTRRWNRFSETETRSWLLSDQWFVASYCILWNSQGIEMIWIEMQADQIENTTWTFFSLCQKLKNYNCISNHLTSPTTKLLHILQM